MKIVVISPEREDPREIVVVEQLCAAGLPRYHLRKPSWTKAQCVQWIQALPEHCRSRVVLHQHHELVNEFGLGGRHWRDDGSAPLAAVRSAREITSRSVHTVEALCAAFGRYDSVFFAPVFPSLSKPGHEPRVDREALATALAKRRQAECRTEVLALGGVAATNVRQCLAMGFDGVALVGAIWLSRDPVITYREICEAGVCHAA